MWGGSNYEILGSNPSASFFFFFVDFFLVVPPPFLEAATRHTTEKLKRITKYGQVKQVSIHSDNSQTISWFLFLSCVTPHCKSVASSMFVQLERLLDMRAPIMQAYPQLCHAKRGQW